MKLIIQIPCYNEAETLEIALDDLPKHIDGIDEIEYLIINDGSIDNTVEVAQKWGVHYIVNFTTPLSRMQAIPWKMPEIHTNICGQTPLPEGRKGASVRAIDFSAGR